VSFIKIPNESARANPQLMQQGRNLSSGDEIASAATAAISGVGI
jgi:hypothetical protein